MITTNRILVLKEEHEIKMSMYKEHRDSFIKSYGNVNCDNLNRLREFYSYHKGAVDALSRLCVK